jgi:hypothetical protein
MAAIHPSGSEAAKSDALFASSRHDEPSKDGGVEADGIFGLRSTTFSPLSRSLDSSITIILARFGQVKVKHNDERSLIGVPDSRSSVSLDMPPGPLESRPAVAVRGPMIPKSKSSAEHRLRRPARSSSPISE